MNEREFDDLLREVKGGDLPPCPEGVEANVLRRVRLHRAEGGLSGWFHFLPPRTVLAMAALALALVIFTSSVVTLVSSSAHTENLRKREETNRVLDLRFVKATTLITFERD